MALKLLHPGLRPMGQFDANDSEAVTITGGEVCKLAAQASEVAAGDVGVTTPALEVQTATSLNTSAQNGQMLFLADEGIAGYGTLFGSMIGAIAGQSTQSGAAGGAVVIGPKTSSGSGKITLFHAAGLYGITAPANPASATGGSSDAFVNSEDLTDLTSYGVGKHLKATAGKLQSTTTQHDEIVAHCVGLQNDESLVSTTSAAATGTATASTFVIYYLGAGNSYTHV
jgi:hypothetical protein